MAADLAAAAKETAPAAEFESSPEFTETELAFMNRGFADGRSQMTADAAIDRAVAARGAFCDITNKPELNSPDATPDLKTPKTPLQASPTPGPLLSTAERRAVRARTKEHAASPAAAFRAWLGDSPLICLSDPDASSDSDPDSDFAIAAIKEPQTPPQTQESPDYKRARNRRG